MPASDQVGSPFFRRWGTFVVRHRWWLLAANLLLTGYLAHRTAELRMDTSFRALEVSDSDGTRALEQLEDSFGRDGMFIVAVGGDVFSLPYLQRLQRMHGELAAMSIELVSLGERRRRDGAGVMREAQSPGAGALDPTEHASAEVDDFGEFGGDEGWGEEEGGTIVDEITSLINVRNTTWQGGSLRVAGLLDEMPTDARGVAALREHVMARRSMVDHVVSAEGTHSVVQIRTDFMASEDSNRVYAEIQRITGNYDAPDFRVSISGGPSLAAEMHNLLLGDAAVMNVLSLLAMLALLAFTFRHIIGVVAPVVVVVEAVLWTTGIMVLCGVDMTMVSIIIPSFLICVGIGDSIHIQSVYRQGRREGMSNESAVIHAIEHTGTPVLFTTLTTCLGLFSFRFASLDAIRDFGVFGGLGVVAALLHSLVLLPIVLTFHRDGRLGAGRLAHASIRGLLRGCDWLSAPQLVDGRLSYRRRNAVAVATGVALLVAVLGVSLASVRHDPLRWLPVDNDARVATEVLDEHVAGASAFTLLIEAHEGKDLKDRELLLGLERLERHVMAYGDGGSGGRAVIRGTAGLLDPIRESWGVLKERPPSAYAVPETQRGVVDAFTMFENSSPDRLRRLLTVDARVGLMLIRLTWMDGQAYEPVIAHIQQGIDRHIGDRAKVTLTGRGLQSVTSGNAIVGDLLKSLAVAIGVITLLMVLLLQDRRLALVAMVPNLMPIIAVIGFMGYAGIPVDMSNLMIASIGIGIAVDDTIHFLHHFKAHFDVHTDVERAIRNAFEHAGQAMVNTTVVLLAGFLVFMSADLGNFRVFGGLIALTVVFAVVIDLAFTPALLRFAFRTRSEDRGAPSPSVPPRTTDGPEGETAHGHA